MTAKTLAARGLHVILVARRKDRLEMVSDHITHEGGSASIIPADLVVENEREALYHSVSDTYGTPDILINNAGLGWYGYYSDMPWQVVQEMILLNILATAHLTRLFLPDMLKLERSRIINVGSVAGKLPEQGIAIYSSTKAFLDSFTTSLYREYRHTALRTTVIRSGPVKTEFFDQARALPNGGNIPAERLAVPAKRIAEGIWKAILRPTRYRYIPAYLFLSPLLEVFFNPIIDLLGPILLKKTNQKPL